MSKQKQKILKRIISVVRTDDDKNTENTPEEAFSPNLKKSVILGSTTIQLLFFGLQRHNQRFATVFPTWQQSDKISPK
ncbi:MAG TPA: hypothetical protein PK239_07785 [Chitinophagales bacterium]|nr:hypothetical protein [Chitinophagales bacterium]